MKTWSAEMPSNIALIKYMGKTDVSKNLPSNASLSWTLPDLLTRVELTESDTDIWQPLNVGEFTAPCLSEKGQKRYIDHLVFLKKKMGLEDTYFQVKSGNNFASDCGLASSASSFAALTMATYQVAKEKKSLDLTIEQVADLSRQGSGSSCRSFFKPWCEWRQDKVFSVDLPYKQLQHQVVVVESSKKQVSSSEAHSRVVTSELFAGRVERAQKRCEQLKNAFISNDWKQSYEICWAEFWDMHALFETSQPNFGYMTDKTFKVLSQVREYWSVNADGPLVTMDAGANVHLLYREGQPKLQFNV